MTDDSSGAIRLPPFFFYFHCDPPADFLRSHAVTRYQATIHAVYALTSIQQSQFIRILSEQFVEAAVTVGLVAGLLERALVQLLQAECAHKVLRMEFTEHGGDAATGYRLGAAGAQRAAFGVIMRLAVRQTFEVEERSMLKRLTAVLRNVER